MGRCRRHTNLGGIVGSTKDELGGTVVSGADIRDVRLVLDKDLGTAEVAQLQDAAVGIKQKVLGLDVSVADALGMDVCQGSEELIDVKLDFQSRHGRLHLVEEAGGTIDGLGNKLLNQIEIDFVLL